jgi:cytochrome b
MVMALLASVTLAALTGWMMEIDMFWGYEWVEEIHEALASLALGLVFIHIAGVIVMSLVEKQNLVKSMLTGFKRG